MKFLIFMALCVGLMSIQDRLIAIQNQVKESNLRACEMVAFQNHAADPTETSTELAQHIQECRKP